MRLVALLLSAALIGPALFVGVAPPAAAQRPAQDAGVLLKAPDALTDPLKYNAFDAIAKEVDRAKEYTQASAKVLVWTAAADAVWDFDPAKSGGLLRDAYAQIGRAKAQAAPGESSAITAARTTALQGRLRAEVLGVAQRHDPSLVSELLAGRKENQSELQTLHQDPLVFGSSSFQKRGLAQLAARLAPTDPAHAVDYAADSLGYGVPQEIQEVFRALIAADPKSAHELFRRATVSYAADPSPNLYDALFLMSYLRLLPQPEADTRLVRSFLGAAFDRDHRAQEQAAASGGLSPGLRGALVNNLNQLQTYFHIYWPERAGEVWTLSKQLAADMPASEAATEELFPTEASRNDAESILARAGSQKDEENRDALLFQAALTLSRQGEHQRALDVAARARPGERRDTVTNYIRRAMAQQLASAGELSDALRVVEKIETPEERADAALLLVKAAQKKKDAVLAASVLTETQKLLAKETGSAPHARAYLWLASAYSAMDPQAGFEMMAAAVKLANAAPSLDDARSEPRLMQLGGASRYAIQLGDTKGDFRPGFQALARADFTRTIALAEGFENELLRGLSVVAAAASILKEKPQAVATK